VSVDFEPVDLDADAEWSFEDLRCQPAPTDGCFGEAWQAQRKRALAERAAVREAASARNRRETLERNLSETRARVEQRRAQGAKPVRKAAQRPAPGVAGQPVPPQGSLLRYARVGACVVAVSVTPAIFGCCRYSVWLWRGGVWTLCDERYDRAAASAWAERFAVALQETCSA
jgi:hypothetical protein